jgi:hypothetical protein
MKSLSLWQCMLRYQLGMLGIQDASRFCEFLLRKGPVFPLCRVPVVGRHNLAEQFTL